ncbi:uncharacterized protein LOC106158567 [Lingula anatina]|uniref:Uncharacterized protein LOC106158567 n=1 Tax=Lingula anatina TaxID=7574 RepID=A0A1S3HVM8_LINAN|nr:uncharacterized protein LOC106158567 [Lingula anatina]|eukprot:XP_013390073.1 uncharacterized protein LOC106158567 [Lingula anatina]
MMETVPDYRSFFKKLSGCFMITDDSAIYEFGETDGEGPDWFHCLEEVMDSYKINITPVQKLLKERQRRREEAKNTIPVSASDIDIDIDIRADVLEATTKDVVNGQVNPTIKDQPLSRRTGWQFAKKNYEVPEHVLKKGEDKLKAVFMKVDTNGNGWIDPTEFSTFLKGLGLTLTEKEINLVYNTIDKDRNGRISFQEFEEYFMRNVLDEQETGDRTAALRAAFMEADRDGSGTLDFKEFTEYYWEKKRNARLDKLMAGFGKLNKKDGDTITFADFENLFAQSGVNMEPPVSSGTQSPKVDVIDLLDKELKEEYDEAAAGELEEYIRDRWEKFASFRRLGASGEAVMTGKDNMVADIVPGEYSLKDIALFSDLPPIVPKYTAVKGVRWVSSGVPGKSGELLFPDDFNYVIAVDLATNERLRYYGCSFADAQQVKVSLLYRHGIQDFTYENQYLEDYVEDRGPGIEVHQFSHLDCPLHEDAGVFVIGKFAGEDEIHLTAFEVPVRHTVYAPAGTIHSNDYLKGTWRTMLSDEAEIDHVYLMKKKENGEMENFKFRFE